MIKSVITYLAPFGLMNAYRKSQERVATVRLSEKHMKNCELLLNRSALLSRLKTAGHIAEIGVNRGEFSEQIMRTNEPELLHLVDVWGSAKFRDGYDEVVNKFAPQIESGRVQIHRKFSTEAAQDFADSYFDWIYIDTDHSYQTTKLELAEYASKVKKDGVIAGHDYSMGNWEASYRYGVIEAVHEFCVEQDWELIYLTADPLENQSFAIRRLPG